MPLNKETKPNLNPVANNPTRERNINPTNQ